TPGGASIGFPNGSLVDAAPGTRLALVSSRGVRLQTGRAGFEIGGGEEGFQVWTPLGIIETAGGSFRVRIESEAEMKGEAGIVVTVAVVGAAVMFRFSGDPDPGTEIRSGELAIVHSQAIRKLPFKAASQVAGPPGLLGEVNEQLRSLHDRQ